MKVAITTDWLNSFGGAERVLVELHRMFPEAPLYTTVYDPAGLPDFMQGWDVRPSFLQRIPLARRRHQWLLPLMPVAFRSFDLSAYDLVITASSAFSKAVVTRPDATNLCYCYTPPRYLWDLRDQYVRGVMRPVTEPLVRHLRAKDLEAAAGVDHFVAISDHTADRVRRHYGRDPAVVYPPVDVRRFAEVPEEPGDAYLVVSRLVGYKRVDLAVEACNRLGRRLVVAGGGPELERLRRLAGPTVEMLGKVGDAELPALYARSRALLFPGLEDFGIVPVEAQAAGRPVVAYGAGGALETVVDGRTGVFFPHQTAESLADAIVRLEETSIDAGTCRANAARFDAMHFRAGLAAELDRHAVGWRAAAVGVEGLDARWSAEPAMDPAAHDGPRRANGSGGMAPQAADPAGPAPVPPAPPAS